MLAQGIFTFFLTHFYYLMLILQWRAMIFLGILMFKIDALEDFTKEIDEWKVVTYSLSSLCSRGIKYLTKTKKSS